MISPTVRTGAVQAEPVWRSQLLGVFAAVAVVLRILARCANPCRQLAAGIDMLDSAKTSWLYHETGKGSYRASKFMAIEW